MNANQVLASSVCIKWREDTKSIVSCKFQYLILRVGTYMYGTVQVSIVKIYRFSKLRIRSILDLILQIRI